MVGYYFENKPVAQAMETLGQNEEFLMKTIMNSVQDSEKIDSALEDAENNLFRLIQKLINCPNDNDDNMVVVDNILNLTNKTRKGIIHSLLGQTIY